MTTPGGDEPRPREAPPWWPTDEPWPPAGGSGRHAGFRGPPWHGARGGQAWQRWGSDRRGPPASLALRIGCGVVLFWIVLVSVATTLAWLVGWVVGLPGAGWPSGDVAHLARFAGGVILVVGVLALVTAGRSLRRSGRTLDDLASAAERVEAGDYRVRVAEPDRGPGELRDLARRFNTMVSRLEADEDRRRALLADVSHELRTPLAVVRGNVEAIVDGVHPADPDHLRAILEEADLMARLIEDLRTLALSEAGRLSLHREPTDPGALVGDVARAFDPMAASSGVSLSVEAEDAMPPVDIDPVRTREVVENLVANAIRHTPSGGRVTIRAEVDDRDLRVAVTDTGPGIDPALLLSLFDRFTKSAESGGSGLGLAIARQLVLAQGGEIAAESDTGRGTTIRFRLPIRST